MTVASLWSVLDHAGCGKAVGARELVDPSRTTKEVEGVNPWNYNEKTINDQSEMPQKRQTLAVDLSIWICEGLTSSAMHMNHADPVLHLVYTRTIRLLTLGLKLVFVIEGKRRIRRSEQGEVDNFRKRRSGTAFWKACKSCEDMLKLLGVHVVRAKAEGEALCALLNQKGIVDGIISKDGDCLLFGAKVVYTRFSIDNLVNSQIMRYDASDLRAVPYDEKENNNNPGKKGGNVSDDPIQDARKEGFQLSREDLIAFALLTGSDMAGDGLSKVGHKKAIRFIRKCQLNFPLSSKTAAIEELKSWARTASTIHNDTCAANTESCRTCSVCTHPGDKRSHEKYGCEICGTQPGEPCFNMSGADKFRRSLRAKALAMRPKFDPDLVFKAYMSPNDNLMPVILAGSSSESILMSQPRLGDMLYSSFLVKGKSMTSSREFIKQTLPKLLARTDLLHKNDNTDPQKDKRLTTLSKEKPIPLKITKRLVHEKSPCFEILWSVNATITDGEGNPVDGYEFSTIEPRSLVEKSFPNLIEKFKGLEQEMKKQGDAEVSRRKAFIEQILAHNIMGQSTAPVNKKSRVKKKRSLRATKQRSGFFENKNGPQSRNAVTTNQLYSGDDVQLLMLNISKPKMKTEVTDDFDYSSIEEGSLASQTKGHRDEMIATNIVIQHEKSPSGQSTFAILTPGSNRVELFNGKGSCAKKRKRTKRRIHHKSDRRKAQRYAPLSEKKYLKKEWSEFKDTPLKNEFRKDDKIKSPILVFSRREKEIGECLVRIDMDESLVESSRHWDNHEGESPFEMKRSSPEQTDFPFLSPNCRRVVCDMGIPIEVTPIVSSKLGFKSFCVAE